MFEKLLTPLQIGSIKLRNRVLMGSMHTGLEEDPEGSRKLAAFYEARAKGGVGLIVTGGFSPNSAGRVFEEGADLVSEDQLEFHRPITEAVHRHGGKILLPISYLNEEDTSIMGNKKDPNLSIEALSAFGGSSTNQDVAVSVCGCHNGSGPVPMDRKPISFHRHRLVA